MADIQAKKSFDGKSAWAAYPALFALCAAAAVLLDPTSARIIPNASVAILTVCAAAFAVAVFLLAKKPVKKMSGELIGAATCLLIFPLLLICVSAVVRQVAALGAAGLVMIAYVAVLLKVTGHMTTSRLILLLIAAGLVLRLCYGLYTPVEVRQHDVESFASSVGGHGAYIKYFYNEKQLPDFDPTTVWQFYHPPLNHILSAVWLGAVTRIGFTWTRALESIQFLTLFYSASCMLICKSIFTRMGLKGGGLICAMSVVCFAPPFIILSGAVNNDMLSITFLLAAISATLRWCDTGKLWDLIKIALGIGLGMSTKLSVAAIAPAVAVIMLIKLIRQKHGRGRLLGNYAAFAGVCFPLGLWWPLRNSIMFGSPINYIPLLSTDSYQYVGNFTFAQRFLLPLGYCWKSEFIHFTQELKDYNVWAGLLKTAVFDEYDLNAASVNTTGFTAVLYYVAIVLALAAFAAMIVTLIKQKNSLGDEKTLLMLGCYVLVLGSYLVMCAGFPHTCTMNIRYATPIIVVGALFLGKAAQSMGQGERGLNLRTVCRYSLFGLVGLYCALSTAVYILLGTYFVRILENCA